jgi:peptidoglycan hydrolase FlgJ
MKLAPIGNLTPQHQAPDADAASVAAQRKVAQQFEAIFLRQMLGALEKTGGLGGTSKGGAAVFRSMMVGALADGAAEGGGIGLADVVFKAMLPPAAPAQPQPVESAEPASQAPIPALPLGS